MWVSVCPKGLEPPQGAINRGKHMYLNKQMWRMMVRVCPTGLEPYNGYNRGKHMNLNKQMWRMWVRVFPKGLEPPLGARNKGNYMHLKM